MDENWIVNQSQIQERPFTSSTPIVGPLIAYFRAAWNSVATKWYVRALLLQQNAFNKLVATQLQEHDTRLVSQDETQTHLTHQMAEMTVQLTQMNRRLQSIEERLSRLEADRQS